MCSINSNLLHWFYLLCPDKEYCFQVMDQKSLKVVCNTIQIKLDYTSLLSRIEPIHTETRVKRTMYFDFWRNPNEYHNGLSLSSSILCLISPITQYKMPPASVI